MLRSIVSLRALAVAALGLGGCAVWEGDELLTLQHRFRTITTGSDGYATVRIPRDEASSFSKVLLAASDDDGQRSVYVDRVEDASGEPLIRFLADTEIGIWHTGAVASQSLNHLNWPISNATPDISGDELRVVIGALNTDNTLQPNTTLLIEALRAQDADFSTGTLGINLIFASDLADDEDMIAAFEEAASRLEALVEPSGLTLEIATSTWQGTTLPRPGFGAPGEWTDITTSTDNLAIDVVVVYDVSGANQDILGAAGSIPGGLIGSEKSGVILSASSNAGPDLRFSDPEIDLLASTMGHEIGHMLGLFHPVELTYDRWDAHDDTDRCTSAAACQGALGSNLMYPAALCSVSGCILQDEVTANQASVLQRYTGVY